MQAQYSYSFYKSVIMRKNRLFLLAISLMVLFSSCFKTNDAQPCPVVDEIMSYRVICFMDKDSNNLLLNGVLDTLDITMKNEKNEVHEIIPLRDSTLQKTRFILLQLSHKQGVHQLRIQANNKLHTMSYQLKIIPGKCYTRYEYSNYMLDETPYQFPVLRDYIMFGGANGHPYQKINTLVEPLYITMP